MTGIRQVKVSVESVTANRRRGGDVRVTLSPATCGATSGFGGRLSLRPGEAIRAHYHPYSEEFIHMITGRAAFFLADQEIALGPGDSLIVPIGVPHRMVNVGDEVVQAVFHLSPLAPLPALGHVDLEPPADAQAPQPTVGSAG